MNYINFDQFLSYSFRFQSGIRMKKNDDLIEDEQ